MHVDAPRYAYQDDDEARLTPAQALYDFLRVTGWVQNKRQFADLVGVDAGNIYNYLADAGKKNRIPATMETLRRWCATISTRTDRQARASFVQTSNGAVEMEGSGFDRNGVPVEPRRYRTVQPAPQIPAAMEAAAG